MASSAMSLEYYRVQVNDDKFNFDYISVVVQVFTGSHFSNFY